MTADRLLTPGDAAKLLSPTAKALDHRRRAGEIGFVPLGRLVRYRQSTILAFIDSNEIRLTPRRPGRPRVVRMPQPKGATS
jgi:hypothetical protein